MTTTDETHLTPTQLRARDDARRLIEAGALVLDTETTGLDGAARLVEIAILAADGTVLLDTLIHPDMPIPPEATAIHGIGDDEVANAPPFRGVWPEIISLTAGRCIIAYNASFDRRIITQHAAVYGLAHTVPTDWRCAMLLWSDYHGLRRWDRLDVACFKAGVPLNGAHRARQDCLATVGVLRWMAGLPALGE